MHVHAPLHCAPVASRVFRSLQVDPFDAQEAKPYKQDPEIIAMTNLVDAYQNNNINEFERILRSNRCAVPAAMHASKVAGLGQPLPCVTPTSTVVPFPSLLQVKPQPENVTLLLFN